jgi:hypothetical protein
MPELLASLDAFIQEHRRCGDLAGGVDDQHVWLACECSARITRPLVEPPAARDMKRRLGL